jgi:hypothetical protein
LKKATAFRMIERLYCALYHGFWAGSESLPRSLSWLTRVHLTLPIPHGLAMVHHGASDRAQHHGAPDAHFTPSEKAVLEHSVAVGDGKGSHFMPLLQNALHITLQARYLR